MRRAGVNRVRGLAAAAVLLTAAAMSLPSAAVAADGSTTLVLDGPAATKLAAAGVRIQPIGAARGDSQRFELPAGAGLAGTSTTLLRQRGGLLLQSTHGHRLRLTGLTVLIGRRSLVTARAAGARIALFRVLPGGGRRIDPDAGSIALSRLRLKLSFAAARLLVRRLQIEVSPRWLQRQAIGRLSAAIAGVAAGAAPGGGGDSGRGAATAASGGCSAPSGAGSEPESPLPVASRPAGAADITAATIDWRMRESFIQYVSTGEGASVLDGAAADPPERLPGASAALSYTFHFPFASGWHAPGADPLDPADDSATIDFGGAVRFQYSAHGIDLTTADPEIEIAGARSRAIFTISEGAAAGERQVLVNLDLSRAAKIEHSGDTYTYERIPGAIPAGTAGSVFAGFYVPGTEFGCVDVSFATGS